MRRRATRAAHGVASLSAARVRIRSCSSARRSRRETCICETPIRSAISDWVIY
jgi:hypothetical protein